MPRGRTAAVALPLAVVGAVFAWWGLREGAYFGVVFLPGALVLLGLLAALLASAPLPGRLRGWPSLALASLALIGALSALSALWSPAPEMAIADAQRALAYAGLFALGLWACLLVGRGMVAAVLPVAASGAVVAAVTLVSAAGAQDAVDLLELDSTLKYPLGYRNAVGAYFLINAFALIVLAAERSIDWRLRGAAAAAAVACVDVSLLAQSRASVFAAAAAVAVLAAVSRDRLRAVGWLALVAAGSVTALPWVLGVYAPNALDPAGSAEELRAAAVAIAVAAAATGASAALLARSGASIPISPGGRRAFGAGLLAVALIACVGGAGALVASQGGPADFLQQRADELTAGSGELDSSQTRFGLDLRTERGDFWRVAIADGVARPLAGQGAGAFRSRYLLDRDSAATPEDPHSVELLMFSELGLPGLLALLAFLLAVVISALRSRRLGPAAGTVAAAALVAGSYWLVHASVEWFWSYPAVTAPVIFLLGAAAAPGLADPGAQGPSRSWRWALIAAVAVLAISLVPPFLSERYTNAALRGWGADLPRAYDDLSRASSLNRLDNWPLLSEAVIAERVGDEARALDALAEARRRAPEDWTVYYLEARALAPDDPRAARTALARALELNPDGVELAALRKRLRRADRDG